MARDSNYYTVLGLDPAKKTSYTADDIRRAYRKSALKYHPDKNDGSPEAEAMFKRVAEAYDVLSDPRRRATFDRYGEAGLKGNYSTHSSPHQNGGHAFGGLHRNASTASFRQAYTFHGDPMAMFAEFFNGRSIFDSLFANDPFFADAAATANSDDDAEDDDEVTKTGRTPFRSKSFNVKSNPSRTKRISIERSDTFVGSGGGRRAAIKDPPVEHELFIALEDIARGVTKRMKITRNVIVSDAKNQNCHKMSESANGDVSGITTPTIRREDKILAIHIKPGWKAGTRITFQREGDQNPGRIAADIVFVVRDKPHPVFTRDGHDIKYVAKISLREDGSSYNE